MATTTLLQRHAGEGETIAEAIRDCLDYGKNPEKTESGKYISAYECDPVTVADEFLLAKASYAAMTGREQKKANDVLCYQMPITVNVAGQVGQIRLPTSKALWPLFETVINSIQSLEESDTKKKVIVIDALRPEHTQLKTGEQGRTIIEEQAHFEAFTVTDNGNGFNSQNHQSFLEAYSQLKVKKGCKGIGRFLWLKAFDKVTVDSIYYEGNHWYSRTFDFALTGINPEQNAKESFHDVTG